MKYILTLLILLFAFPVQTEAQEAQQMCGNRTKMVLILQRDYNQIIVVRGLLGNGEVFEILTTRDGSKFTILSTRPNGVTCVVGWGEGLHLIEYQEAKD